MGERGNQSPFVTYNMKTQVCVCTTGDGKCSRFQDSHMKQYHIYQCADGIATPTPAPKPTPKPLLPKPQPKKCSMTHRGKHCASRRYYGKRGGSVEDCHSHCRERGNQSPFVTYNMK